ncbi:MAG: hypothetical protein JHC95_12385 [Solirubrobacteraceae bacterium]|nr:hypothetical protein [Solirubrobacteraceae bacterium]
MISTLDEGTVQDLIFAALERLNDDLETPVEIAPETPLFGSGSEIDSFDLVALIVDVEAALRTHGLEVTLTNDEAISREVSPFTDVQAMTAYILELARAG